MADTPQAATGGDNAGAQGASSDNTPTPAPASEPKSINSQAKDLPWVQNALKAEAELAKLKAAQAEAKQAAEREKAESEGRYKDALKMEQKKYEELAAKHAAEVKRLSLTAAFSQAGLRDLRAAKLFEEDYDPEKESAEQYVTRIKADEKNALYFSDPKQTRTPAEPTPAAGIGNGEKYDPSWIHSSDPQKKAAALEHNRKAFWKKYHGDSR